MCATNITVKMYSTLRAQKGDKRFTINAHRLFIYVYIGTECGCSVRIVCLCAFINVIISRNIFYRESVSSVNVAIAQFFVPIAALLGSVGKNALYMGYANA